jgi:phospholipase/carboxylesterase
MTSGHDVNVNIAATRYNASMRQMPEAVEHESGPKPEAAVIWLHGLGADGHDFEPLVPELGLAAAPAVRFVFPHAPVRPVTINMGMRMRAWYDVARLGGGPEDEAGIRASQAALAALIDRETARGIAPGRVVLAGFSQGGAIALQCGLRHPQRLAGILALSTYLPLAATLAAEASDANRSVPLFMAHGSADEMIALERAERSRDALRTLGYRVEWRVYPMGHAVCAQEVGDIAAWLGARLGG